MKRNLAMARYAMRNCGSESGHGQFKFCRSRNMGRSGIDKSLILLTLEFIATIANATAVNIFESVKKSKAWMHLRNSKSCDGRKFDSLDEFCEVSSSPRACSR